MTTVEPNEIREWKRNGNNQQQQTKSEREQDGRKSCDASALEMYANRP